MKVLSPDKVQAWEEATIAGGTPVEALMREAVGGMLRIILDHLPHRRVQVLAGKGHNGDDALWLGHALREAGRSVEVILSHPPAGRAAPPVDPIHQMAATASVWPDLPPEGVIKSG